MTAEPAAYKWSSAREVPVPFLALFSGKGIDDPQVPESVEISIAGQELENTVLEAQRRDMGIVDQVSGGAGAHNDSFEKLGVVHGFRQQSKRGRSKNPREIRLGAIDWNRRMIDARMGHHTQELVDARPGNRPWNTALGHLGQESPRHLVMEAGRDLSENQNVGVDRSQR